MKYLQRKFSFAAGTPQISDEDWAAAFSEPKAAASKATRLSPSSNRKDTDRARKIDAAQIGDAGSIPAGQPLCDHHWAFDGERWFCLICTKLKEEVNAETE